MDPRRIALALGSTLLAVTGLALVAPAAAPAHDVATQDVATRTVVAPAGARVTDGCLKSVREGDRIRRVSICYTIFRPAGADRRHRVPFLLHSHGWGGSRTQDPAEFRTWLDAGYGVLSFDQRGFGESSGKAHVESPDFEGHDVRRLIRLIAGLPWVRKDGPRDPRLGALGGSYGGGYQYLAAFESLRRTGKPVLDALAPEITWYDVKQSLAPEEVVRTEWASVLAAAALPSRALYKRVYKALTEGAATGMWPDGSVPGTENLTRYFRKNGPRWHVSHGRRLDIPVLMGQGTTDSLFALRQGLANWKHAITRRARQQSIFVGYNGGHVLPKLYPQGVQVDSDPCSEKLAGGSFSDLALRFMDEQLKGRDRGLTGYGRFHLATPDTTCTTVGSVAPDTTFDAGVVATTEGGSAPTAFPVAEGPIRIAGESYLTGTMTAVGVNNRAFYGLAVGTTPSDAHLVQNNELPFNELEPVLGERRRIALPAVAVDVPEGQTLYVMASGVSDTFAGMGSRTPGAVVIEDTVVHLPVVGR